MIQLYQTLDLRPIGIPQTLRLSQYDSDFEIIFELTNFDGAWILDTNTTAEVQGTKTDGHGYSADAVFDDQLKTVTIAGDVQMTAAAGRNTFEVVLFHDGDRLGSKNFILDVERAALDAETTASDSQIKNFTEMVEAAEDAAEAATAAAEDAAEAISSLAPAYSSSATYALGAYCIYGGVLYRCISAITAAEAWTAAHWAAVSLAGDTDIDLYLSKVPADAYMTGMGLDELTTALKQVYTQEAYSLPLTLNYGGVGLSSGGNYQNAGYCRTNFLPVSGKLLIVCNNIPGYRITGWLYSRAASSAGTHSITNQLYVASKLPLIIEPQAGDAYLRFGFRRADNANLTTDTTDQTSDYSIIRAAVAVYAIPGNGERLVDSGLGDIGKFATMEMFTKWAVCGASRDAGYMYPTASGSGTTKRALAWGAMAAKRAGNDCAIFAIAGITAAGWVASDSNYGLQAMLAAEAKQLYVVSFGYNEASSGSAIGTAANMHAAISDYTAADLATMYGALSYIVLNIKEHAPNALIIGLFRYANTMAAAYLDAWNCVKAVAAEYEYPVINWCDSPIHNKYLMDTDDYKYGAHPTATGYSMMASVWDDLFSRCVFDNWEYFSHFIG